MVTADSNDWSNAEHHDAKLYLWLTKHHAMKTYVGVEVQPHAFLISAPVGSEWSASRHVRFNPGVRASGTHWIGG
jgi:hypothetical protein